VIRLAFAIVLILAGLWLVLSLPPAGAQQQATTTIVHNGKATSYTTTSEPRGCPWAAGAGLVLIAVGSVLGGRALAPVAD
jgi:hypothetical protein